MILRVVGRAIVYKSQLRVRGTVGAVRIAAFELFLHFASANVRSRFVRYLRERLEAAVSMLTSGLCSVMLRVVSGR